MAGAFSNELSVKDYVSVLKRRGAAFFWSLAPVLTLGAALAFGLPPVYESTGTILIEQQDVPERLVQSTVTGVPDQRIRTVSQRVMTQEKLGGIIERLDVYPDLAAESMRKAVSELRSNVTLGAVESEINDSALGQRTLTTAFTLAYGHSSPVMARRVADELITLFLDENRAVREQSATETREFLAREARRLEGEIEAIEADLAAFKSEHANSLPELADLNMAAIDRAERDLEAVQREIRTLREQRNLLQSELAQLSPYDVIVGEDGNRILSARDRLKLLERRLAELAAVYSDDHPDVRSTRREIEALRAQTGGGGSTDRDALRIELQARQEELDAARERYSDDHPDVRRLERIVANLQSRIESAPAASSSDGGRPPPDNPAYIQKQVQLEGTQIDLRAAIERRNELQSRIETYEERLARTPRIEQDYNLLQRRRDRLVARLNQIQEKQHEAELALNLESENKGERFTLLEAPVVPTLPSSPNRIAILMLTVVLAFSAGVGTVAVAEISDTRVRGPRDVVRLLEMPPIASIPYIENPADTRRKHVRRLVTATAVAAWIAVTALLVVDPPFGF